MKHPAQVHLSTFAILLFTSSLLFAQWEPISKPTSSVVRDLAVSGSRIFAATDNGVFVSGDGGVNWKTANSGLTSQWVTHLATRPGALLAATKNDGVFISTNHGEDWRPINPGLPETAVSMTNADGVTVGPYTFAASPRGVHRSDDGGATWQEVNRGLPNTNVWSLETLESKVFAGTDAGVYVSSDFGDNWAAANTGFPPFTEITALVAIQDLLFAGAATAAFHSGFSWGTQTGIYYSRDSGANWIDITSNFARQSNPASFHGRTQQAVSLGSVILLSTWDGVYRSEDNGENWSHTSVGGDSHGARIASIGSVVFAGNLHMGLARSTDQGLTWTPLEIGLPGSEGIMALASRQGYLYVQSFRGIFRSADLGDTWVSLAPNIHRNTSSGYGTTELIVSGENLYFCALNRLLRSSDSGDSWSEANPPFKQELPYWEALKIHYVAHESRLFAFVKERGIFRSDDNAHTWSRVSGELPDDTDFNAFASVGSKLVVASSKGLFQTTDLGSSWKRLEMGIPDGAIVSDLAVAGSTVFARTNKAMFRSTDSGLSWSKVGPAGQATRIESLATVGGFLFASNEDGIFRSGDGGQSWTRVNNGLTDTWVEELESIGEVLFASASDGIFRSTDKGDNWVSSSPDHIDRLDGFYLAVLDSSLFVANESGLFRSDDLGNTWTATNAGIPNHIYVEGLVSIGDTLLTRVEDRYFETKDDGQSWTEVDLQSHRPEYSEFIDPYLKFKDPIVVIGTRHFAFDDRSIYWSDKDMDEWIREPDQRNARINDLIAAGGELFAHSALGMFRVSYDTREWVEINEGLPGKYRPCGSLATIDSHIFLALENDIFRSDDRGVTWQSVISGLEPERRRGSTSCLVLAAMGAMIFVENDSGVIRSPDLGTSWEPVNSGLPDNPNINSLAVIESRIFAGTDRGVFVSVDFGDNWSRASNGLPASYDVRDLAVAGQSIYTSMWQAPYMSADRGESWVQANSAYVLPVIQELEANSESYFLSTGTYFQGQLYRMAHKENGWTRILDVTHGMALGVSGNRIFMHGGEGGGMIISADEGNSWSGIKSNGLGWSLYVREPVEFDGLVLTVTREGVFASTDSGKSWKSGMEGLPPNLWINDLVLGANDLFAVTEAGIYRLCSGNNSWDPISSGLPKGSGREPVFAANDAYFFAFSRGGGWRLPLGDTVTENH